MAYLVAAVLYAAVPNTTWAFTPAIWLGLLLNWQIGAYYRRTFGDVAPAHARSAGERMLICGMIATAILLFMWISIAYVHLSESACWRLFFGGGGVLASCSMVIYYARQGGLRWRPYWLLFSLLLGAVSLLILFAPFALAPLREGRWIIIIWMVPLSLAEIVGGILDHLLLVRTFVPLPREPHDPSTL
jgi:hypothetical protein